MEEEIADKDKDCSPVEGNVLSGMTLLNEFRSFGGLSLFCRLCVIWLAVGSCVWELKIGLEVHESCCVSELEQGVSLG